MNDCPNGEMRDRLPDLLHDRLDPAARREVEAHVHECALCRDELELLREMRRALHRVPAVDVGAIVAALPAYREAATRAPAGRSWNRNGWRIAAAITLLAAGGTSVAIGRRDRALPAGGASVAAAPKELYVATSAISDLDESELAALLDDIESLDAVTPVEVDQGVPVSPLSPSAATSPPGAGA